MISLHTCPYAALGGKETGGMNVYVRELSRHLADAGVQVDVFTRSQNPRVDRVVYISPGVRNVHLPAGPEAPHPKAELVNHIDQFVEGVDGFARQQGMSYQLIHSHYWLSGLAAVELRSRWGGPPLVQMFHTLARVKNLVAQGPDGREPEARAESEERLVSLADAVVAANQTDLENMVRLYGADPARIRVIPCGVDLELFRPIPQGRARQEIRFGGGRDEKLVLYVGRIEPIKGLDVLMRAMALLLRWEPELAGRLCVCVIGGNGEEGLPADRYERRLAELQKRLGVEEMVTFLGPKEQTKLPYYYGAADAVVMPSYYESFGMVALEAMACGRPVVASAVGGLQHTVEDGQTGFLVPPDDPLALAEKIRLLLGDGELQATLGRAAARAARSYSWAGIARQVMSLYGELAAAPVL